MASFKLIAFCFLFLFVSKLQAQKHPVLYAGFEAYRHTGFEDNSFGKFSVGSQIYQIKFLAPEIGFDYGGGTLPERTVFGKNFNIQDPRKGLLRQRFKFSVLILNPKLKFGEEDAYITFSPKYHIGTLRGEAAYLEYSDDNRYIGLKESENSKIDLSFWSFAIGFEGLQITSKYWFALSLHYTLVNANDVWDTMGFSAEDAFMQSASTSTIGLGFRFYYNPFGSEND
ncbi:hypothetical protein APR41_09325 [Salegentibacter salinarum]|uniref:Outer membrane protein beta-barrel domain-containing protein n=1 Tax=Salegentibacter salinarum TaxID=447422 RepID=A0A2N0TP80_9FLAO|nr:hypothetical protein [Salegentibacter salinarum]PKD16533.1 hypothetical protein APR41_09325 [Salegentibacter salinarum]SKB65372.1 hypothetical protein SAMN05660903_01899 [Salegentibacter salinarum]